MKRPTLSTCLGLMAYVMATSAQAELVVTMAEVGPDVVFTSDGGSINLADLSYRESSRFGEFVTPSGPFAGLGTQQTVDVYDGGFSGPSNYGPGGGTFWDSSTGPDAFGFNFAGQPVLFVPAGYTSGAPLIFSNTFDNTDLTTMGIPLGTYTWTWGSGENADSFTLITSPVPEPSSCVIFALAGLGGLLYARRRKKTSSESQTT